MDPKGCKGSDNAIGQTIEFKDNIEDINEWKHNWMDGEISYRLNNYTTDTLPKWQTRAVTVALRVWQLRITKLKFRRERNPDHTVDINVNFEPGDHFDSDTILAHAYYPGQGDISGDCHINDKYNWQPGVHLSDLSRPPLVPVLIHEFGHSLGLKHDTSTKESIMYPSISFANTVNKLGPRDISRIQERYGVRKLSNRFIRYFQNRRTLGWDFK